MNSLDNIPNTSNKDVLLHLKRSLYLSFIALLDRLGDNDSDINLKRQYYNKRWNRSYMDKATRHYGYEYEKERLLKQKRKSKKYLNSNIYGNRQVFLMCLVLLFIILLISIEVIKVYVGTSLVIKIGWLLTPCLVGIFFYIFYRSVIKDTQYKMKSLLLEEFENPESETYQIFIHPEESHNDKYKCLYDDKLLRSLPTILGVLMHYQYIKVDNLHEFCRSLLSVINTKSGSYMKLHSFYNRVSEVKNNPAQGEKEFTDFLATLNKINLKEIN